MRAGLIPGQGIPAATVLKALPENDGFVRRAEEALGYSLRRRVEIAGRRKNALLPTELAQPGIFVASALAHDAKVGEGESFEILAGHSLGEYAALVAGGSLSFEEALAVVQVRGEEMHKASKEKPGTMAALIGFDTARARELAAETGAIVANDNAPDQVVIAGSEEAVERAAQLASSQGKRSVLLEVSGAFHTEAVAAAAAPLADALEHVEVRMPRVPVVSNVTARPYESPEEIRKLLVEQLTSEVRWRESVEFIWSAGAREFTDLGPGRVVGPLAQRTVRTLTGAEKREEEVSARV
jgi:[acyl-carrier-protein] S-malonyltransferase